jgi:hypothetical protein
MPGGHRVADPREHIGDRIAGHGPFRFPCLENTVVALGLPARFRYTGDLSGQRQLAETDAAEAKLTHEAAGAPAAKAPIPMAYAQFGHVGIGGLLELEIFCDFRSRSHESNP